MTEEQDLRNFSEKHRGILDLSSFSLTQIWLNRVTAAKNTKHARLALVSDLHMFGSLATSHYRDYVVLFERARDWVENRLDKGERTDNHPSLCLQVFLPS